MDTTATVTLALTTGVITGLGSSLITARVAIGDRQTRLKIAKEDREGAHRRSACIDLEAERILQTEYARDIYLQEQGSLTTTTPATPQPERNLSAEAGMSLLLSERTHKAVEELNKSWDTFLTLINTYKVAPAGLERPALWDNVEATYQSYKKLAEELRSRLRLEMATYPT